MLLGDLGADVVKVEKLKTGEETRGIEPLIGGDSLFFMVFNRNKKSVTLNLRDPRGQEILRELAAEADILVENFRPGVMEKMGCGWETLHELNPRLIMARISGYGDEGPNSDRPCFDAVAQAASGLMSMTGSRDGPPTLMGTTVVDHATALHASLGILAALQARNTTGFGQVVRVALIDSALSMLMTAIPAYQLLGEEAQRFGNRDRFGAPSNSYVTSDGARVQIVAGGDSRFARFVEATGLTHLGVDPRFASNAERRANVDALEEEIHPWMGSRTANEVVEIMAKFSVPCAKVAEIADVVADPQLRHRGQIIEIEHAEAGKIPMHGFVTRLSETDLSVRHPIPTAGQHTAEILSEWIDYDREEVAALQSDSVV
jgi:CoA:oxalate CoA-transferase